LTQPFQLVEVNKIPDEKLKQEVWLGIMELCMKHVFARDILPYLRDMLSLLKTVGQQQAQHYVEATLTYLFNVSNVRSREDFLEVIEHQLTPEVNMASPAQILKAEGRKEGKTEAKQDIARKLWKQQGMALEDISQITDLSMTDLEKLLVASS
jgi:predicted transposase/invertase (TIGR01784 family)